MKSINYETLLTHLGDDKELAGEILQVFINDGPDRLESFRAACESSNDELMIKFSHSLKGISATIRAEDLSALAEKAEKLSRSGMLEDACRQYAFLKEELDKVLKDIAIILEG
ncbi:Hpt domain-containing protein [Maridesulfovibrio bastinii]|uniref:Hpt domain-containing protein n=1 Tax=Maridesulfovibrio bastinii TaxID=47157 RepID=UPI000422E417|nr:Hpt domain-containing protein [Maridesulfovibrio bastinii]